MVDDDVVYPITSNEDLIAVGLPLEDNDTTTLFGVDLLVNGSAPIDLDGGGAGEAVTATGLPVGSNTNGTDDTPTSSVGKRKSGVWVDFEEIYDMENGNKI